MNYLKNLGIATRFLLIITVILGIGYPFSVYLTGLVVAKHQENGSLIVHNGQNVGSVLIGQNFNGPMWFHSRPSQAGKSGYDPLNSSASNAGPNDPALTALLIARKAAIAKENGVPLSEVPADAITSSGSGLDPDISIAYARIQARRVAQANNMILEVVMKKISEATHHRLFGIIGEDTVNVLKLNLSLKG